jgi:ferredoxin
MTNATVRRNIISIDEAKCDGCGLCIPDCPEGAIQLVSGKARLVGELLCDGLGACLGRCPQGAISIEEREAAPYDERQVMARVVPQGPAVVQAHLKHLRTHHQTALLGQALDFLRAQGAGPVSVPGLPAHGHGASGSGCPGSKIMSFQPKRPAAAGEVGKAASQLRHWPIQLHLLNPLAPHYQGSNLLLAADCVPFALAEFHQSFLQGKTLAIACPKLDQGQEVYADKLAALVEGAQVNSITVMIMQVPCCQGLLRLAQAAMARSQRKIPLRCVIVSLQGEICRDETA